MLLFSLLFDCPNYKILSVFTISIYDLFARSAIFYFLIFNLNI